MKDFEEIAHSGGKIQIVINDTRVHFKIEHNNSTKVKIECLQFDLGVNTLPIYIISDSEGMFGAHCSECDNYFRTSNLSSEMFCPYCGIKNDITNFLTKNQNEYIEKYIEVFQSLFSQGKSGEIEFDKLVDCIGEKNSFTYSEERQQTNFTCSECEVSNDVIGKYANCSNCGKRNSIDIFRKNISFESDRIANPRYNDDNRALREKEWIDVLKNAVSIFEGYAKDINNEILKNEITL